MLLYICNLWKYSKEIRKSKLKNKHMFWDKIWELMRLTYNRKYPNQEMSKSDLELTFEHFFAEFGDERGADLFWFGFYGTETFTEKPWELLAGKPWELLDNEEGTKELKDVKVNYDSMMEEEAEKLGFFAWISNVIYGI
jgi:hypothetical protein